MFAARVDQLVFDFNCRPLDYVHPSWIDAAHSATLERLSASRDTAARVHANDWLLRRFSLRGSGDFDFTTSAKRLLLLDGPALADVALWLGLSALVASLRTWVGRARQLELRDALGAERFEWFVGALLHTPPVARWPLPAQSHRSPCADVVALASGLGTRLLLLAADRPGSPSMRRAQLKLPRGTAAFERERGLSPRRAEAVVGFAVSTVIRQRHAAWHWLF